MAITVGLLCVDVSFGLDAFDNVFMYGQALYPRDADSTMQKYAHSQIDANTKTAHFHDEFKVQLPPNLSPEHHLLFTFFHVDLQMKLEAPKPVCFYFEPLRLSSANNSICFFSLLRSVI